ncbi:MAG: hypothetical protein WAQ53_01185 [Thiofilum sp.]|uniref:hypothetical protein n=1 Tax=Thiofilum sp. TaxID=2212733 RepID=UPI0025DF3997|nr:hypothetical protein [Thiofilum sp.]MBK8455504.1 hypothetical protein [Thiofilum sp.]
MQARFLLALGLAIATFNVQADQCQLIEPDQMARALDHIKPNSTYIEFCEPCGDKDFFRRKAQTVRALAVSTQKVGNETYWALKLNGKEVDLAYTFVRKADGSFINLSKLADCPSSDVSVGFAAPSNTK